MRINKGLMAVGVVVVLSAWWLFTKGSHGKDKEEQKIIHPHYGQIENVINTTATILPKNRLEIKPPVNGRIEKILVQEGQVVKPGQIMAWMSSTDRAALLDSARGQGEKEFQYWQDVYKPIPLLAPIEAQVIVATIQPGQTIAAGEAALVLSDHLIVRAQVDETDIGKIKIGQKAVVSLDAYAQQKIQAKVDHIYYESTTLNNVTIYNVDLMPQEIPSFFRSGMNASVDFIIEEKENVLLLPLNALIRKDDGSYVWLREHPKAKAVMRLVKTGISDEKNIEILDGLKEDDEILLRTNKFALNKFKSGSNPFMVTGRPGNASGRSNR